MEIVNRNAFCQEKILAYKKQKAEKLKTPKIQYLTLLSRNHYLI